MMMACSFYYGSIAGTPRPSSQHIAAAAPPIYARDFCQDLLLDARSCIITMNATTALAPREDCAERRAALIAKARAHARIIITRALVLWRRVTLEQWPAYRDSRASAFCQA